MTDPNVLTFILHCIIPTIIAMAVGLWLVLR